MHRPHVLDARGDRRQLLEPAPLRRGDEMGQGRLAGARRAPDDRRQRPGRPRGAVDQPAQRAARAQHVSLAADLLQRPGPHPRRERREGRRPEVRSTGRGASARGGEQVVIGAGTHGWQAIPRETTYGEAPRPHRPPGCTASARSSDGAPAPSSGCGWSRWCWPSRRRWAAVTGESLFDRLSSGDPSVPGESSTGRELLSASARTGPRRAGAGRRRAGERPRASRRRPGRCSSG